MRRTLTRPFAFSVTIELDEEGRAALRDRAKESVAVVETLEIRGVVHRPGHAVTVSALGFDLLETRQIDAERTYIRLDTAAVSTLAGSDRDPTWYLDDLGELSAEHRAALEDGLAGRWMGLDIDGERLGELTDGSGAHGAWALGAGSVDALRAALEEHVAATPGEFLDRYAVVQERRTGEVTHLDIDLLLEPLAGPLAAALVEAGPPLSQLAGLLRGGDGELPSRLSGLSMEISDRVIERVSLDLLAAARSAGLDDVPGSLRVVVDLSEHGRVAAVEPPAGARVIDLADLLEDLGSRYPHRVP